MGMWITRGIGASGKQQALLQATGLSNITGITCNVVQRERAGATGSSSGGERASGSTAAFSDNRREIAFAAILALVGIAALYPALKLGTSSGPSFTEPTKSIALNPRHWVKFTLQESQRVTHDTRIFRFKLSQNISLGLHPASYLLTRAEIEISTSRGGRLEQLVRPYTPISDSWAKGYFDLMIKIYPEGLMSRHIARLNPGDTLEVRGPVGELLYKVNMKKHLGMIAGDIGIAPLLQLLNAIMSNPKDITQVSLIYENESPEDILVKDKLDGWAKTNPNFKVFYTVDIASREWRGGLGHVSGDMILKGLPHSSDDTLILVSGPPKMIDRVCGAKVNERHHGQVIISTMDLSKLGRCSGF